MNFISSSYTIFLCLTLLFYWGVAKTQNPFLLNIFAPINPSAIQPLAAWVKLTFLPPLGISFLSFESIAYLIDVYKGSPATGNLLKHAAYKSFFPKLVSGPITHYHQFAPQLNNLRFPSMERLAEAG